MSLGNFSTNFHNATPTVTDFYVATVYSAWGKILLWLNTFYDERPLPDGSTILTDFAKYKNSLMAQWKKSRNINIKLTEHMKLGMKWSMLEKPCRIMVTTNLCLWLLVSIAFHCKKEVMVIIFHSTEKCEFGMSITRQRGLIFIKAMWISLCDQSVWKWANKFLLSDTNMQPLAWKTGIHDDNDPCAKICDTTQDDEIPRTTGSCIQNMNP